MLKINKSWFYSAGNRWGWTPDFEKKGVGIDMDILDRAPEILTIQVDGISYKISKLVALVFISKYKSVMNRKGARIGVVSKSLCEIIG